MLDKTQDPVIAKVLAAADATTITPKSFAPEASSSTVIDEMTKTMRKTRDFALRHIDDAIERLKKLRSNVEKDYLANEENIIGFVRLIEDGLRDTERLTSAADEITAATGG